MATGNFSSNVVGTPAVSVTGTNGVDGIDASSDTGTGVVGNSTTGYGVVGNSKSGNGTTGNSETGTGVHGQSQTGRGVEGISVANVGVYGQSQGSAGVYGQSSSSTGIAGHSDDGTGVSGEGHIGVSGKCTNVNIAYGSPTAGIIGTDPSAGVYGEATTPNNPGVHGRAINNGWGVYGTSMGGYGVIGASAAGAGVHGTSLTGNAGEFEGNVAVNGNITVTGDIVLTNADCAEEFDIAEAAEAEPGTVMVLDQDGALQPSQYAYDKTVVGVISGAGDFKPGIVLDKRQLSDSRMPVALVGKVYCKVDAQYAAIKVGDLLTTSLTPGHAMKADDPLKAFGSVIGKALRPLETGQGLVPILIALQ